MFRLKIQYATHYMSLKVTAVPVEAAYLSYLSLDKLEKA